MKLLNICSKVLILLFCAIGLTGCFTERWSWHQKLIVEVETPSGLVSGAAVVEVGWNGHNSFSHSYPGSYKGEATLVDLGDGRFLFALVSDDTRYLAFRAFNGNYNIGEEVFAAMEKTRGSKTVQREDYPMFITYSSNDNPKSAREVDPDNLAATFGPGYSLKSVTLEITDEPLTLGKIEKVLGWINDEKILTNPGWSALPIFSRVTINGLRKP